MNVGEQERWEANTRGLWLTVRISLITKVEVIVKVEETAVYLSLARS
jgi:hypothetical protein